MSDNKELLPIAWRWRWKEYVTSIGPSHPKYGWQYEDGAEKPSVHQDNVQHIDFQPLYAAQPVVLTDEHVRAAGGIVHKDGNIFFTNIGKLNAAILAAKEQA